MKILLSWLVTAVIICVAIFLSHMPPAVVFRENALVLVLGPQLVFLIFEYGRNFFSFISRLNRNEGTEADQNNLTRTILLGLIFSAFGYLLGIIQILRNAGTVDAMGPGVSLALMSALYSAVTPVLFIRSVPKEKISTLATALGTYIVIAATALLALTFFAIHALK